MLLRLPWRTWVCPCEGQVWRWCSCLGRRGSGSTRCSGELATSSRKYSALEGHGNKYWPTRSSVLAWRTASLTEKLGRPQSTRTQPVGHCQRDSVHTGASLFFARGSSAPVRADPEGSAAAWLAGALEASGVQRHGLPLPQELRPYHRLLLSLVWLAIRRPLWPVFLCSSAPSGS